MNKVEQALYWPEPMLQQIKEEAVRLDRSISWCVYQAWQLARPELTALPVQSKHARAEARYEADYAGGDKRKQTLIFPEEMLKEIKSEAERQDRSLSWIAQRAWCLAIDEIKKLPSAEE